MYAIVEISGKQFKVEKNKFIYTDKIEPKSGKKVEFDNVLFISNKGKVKIANKLGEEAVETITAYLYEGKKELLEESADLIFHLLVLLEDSGLSIEEVEKTLKKRMNYD